MSRMLNGTSLFILSCIFLSGKAFATPTLDNIHTESGLYRPVSSFALQTTEIEGYSSVQISGTTYYFNPKTDTLAKVLSTTPARNLISTTPENAIFEYANNYYAFDLSTLPTSSYEIIEGDETNYNFISQEKDEENNFVDKYYKINLKISKTDTINRLSWTEVSATEPDTVAVQLPNSNIRYFKYSYTPDTDRTTYQSHQTTLSGDIDADFIKNPFYSGGAIYNDNTTIGNISGDFIGNYAPNPAGAYGGAIYNNKGQTGNIIGNFIGNYSSSSHSYSYGGAIYNNNYSTMGDITGDFIGNYALNSSNVRGGAIYNYNSIIGNITGAFIGNYVYGTSYIYAGAIFNSGTNSSLGNITGDFIGNYVHSSSYAYAGAIFNSGTNSSLGNITGDFIGNYAYGYSTYAGAIFNEYSTIGTINGNFINNYSYASSYGYSGAIYNYSGGTIGDINGDFIGNYVYGYSAYGGAIYNNNNSTISNITGDFVGNNTNSTGGYAYGGAIFNSASTIDNITGNFIGNYASSSSGIALGGAIHINEDNSAITVSTTEAKKSLLFENNKIISFAGTENEEAKLSSINFASPLATLNFETMPDSYINLRDSMTSFSPFGISGNYGILNKRGLGSFYLWGDNSEFGGTINVEEGDFAALFSEAEDLINDPLGQRQNFNLSNATINFADGTTFRPMVTDKKIAKLDGTVTVGDNVALRPYNVSALSAGTHTYTGVDYSAFAGTKTDLLEVDTSSSAATKISVKNLAGYEGMGAAVDAYRKQILALDDRIIFDNIYYTGTVPAEVKNNFKEVIKVVSGEDKIIINEVHKASVRQFSRQIYSRIQNKNCPSCGMTEGYSDEHLWFNVGKNFVDKDTNGNNVGYKYDPTSLAIGYDHDLIPNALNVGIAFSYAFGDVKGKGKNIYNTAEIDEYMLSLYWKYKPLRAYMTGSVGGGYMNSESKVQGSSIDVRGDSDTRVVFINTEFGYDFGNACGVLEPFVGFEYAYIYNKAYTERGLGARHFASSDYNSIELPIGFRVSRNMAIDRYILTPSIELAYSRSLGDNSSEVESYFVGSPESPWVMRGAGDSRDSLRSSLNLKINNIYNPFAFNLGYARDTRSDYSDDQLYLTIRYNF